jgi:hypothetical protein
MPGERSDRYHQQQRTNNVDVAASRNFNRQQWIPGERQNQMRASSANSQYAEQHENNSELTEYKCYFQCKSRFVNRGYSAEEELRPGWIWTRQIRIVQVARFRGVQFANGGIAGNDKVRVEAEALQAAIPDISMNVVVCSWWEPKKFNVPNSGKDESNDDNTPGKFWGAKKLRNCKQVCGGRKRQ